MLCGGRVIQPRMYDALRRRFLTGEPNHDFSALGWPHKVRGNQNSDFHPSVPNVIIFQMHLEGKGLEREPSNKKLHCSRHCLQAFCLNFHNNPLCYRDHKAEEKVGQALQDLSRKTSAARARGSGTSSLSSPVPRLRPLTCACLGPSVHTLPSGLWSPLDRVLRGSSGCPPAVCSTWQAAGSP